MLEDEEKSDMAFEMVLIMIDIFYKMYPNYS